MTVRGWTRAKLGDLGKDGRPALKAGPFGSSLKKEIYALRGFKIYGQEQVIADDAHIGDYYIDAETFQSLRSCEVVPGDVLLSLVGTIGRVMVVPKDAEPGIINPRLVRLSVDTSRAVPDFIKCILESPDTVRKLIRWSQGGTMDVLNAGVLAALPVELPSPPEQLKIAAIGAAWQSGASRLEALVEAKRTHKRGLMQQLLTGRKRFKEFEGQEWRSFALGEILNFEPRVVTKPKGAFLAAGIRSHGKGVFLKPDFEADDIALDELFQLRTDDLVVNITFAWEGAVAIVPPGADGALVSHRFPTFTFKRSVSFPGYFRHVIRQKRFVHELGLVSPGGAGRNRVLSKSDFLRIRVELPSFEEQQRIDAVLNASDREIELLQKQLAALKEQKRGLMQKLLTGEVRVKVGDGGRRSEVSGRREELQEKKRNGKEHND